MKLGIFYFCTVRGFDVLQFEAKQPGRKKHLFMAKIKLILGYFKYLVNGRLGHRGQYAKNIWSTQQQELHNEQGNVYVKTVQFIAGLALNDTL